MANICIHVFVDGHVQGVWFRDSTKREADRLGVTGWVRNLTDGQVEVVAAGSEDAVNELNVWLHKGPAGSSVSSVMRDEIPWEDFPDFAIRAYGSVSE